VTPDVQPLSAQHRTKATAAIDFAASGELGLQLHTDKAGLGRQLGALTEAVVARTADGKHTA